MVRTETGGGATLAGRPELGTILDFIGSVANLT